MNSDAYKARSNEVLLPDGRQMLVVLPSNCTRKEAAEMARVIANWLNARAAGRVAQLDEMVRRGTEAWKDLPDGWLEDLRGNGE